MSEERRATAVNPPSLYNINMYSHGLLVGDILHISGQVGLPITDVEGGAWDFRAEVRQCFKNIEKVVVEAGGRMSDVVKLTCYLTAPTQVGDIASAVEEFFPNTPLPAMSALVVKEMIAREANIEIDGVAILDPSRRRSG